MGFWTSMLFLVLVCSNSVQCSCGFVSLKCNSDNQGKFGHQSLLECVVNLSEEARDARITDVFWAKEGAFNRTLIDYKSGVLQSGPRFTFADPDWKATMNVSMLVNETKIADVGNYSCTVFTNRDYCTTSVSLSISAPYSDPIIGSVMEDKGLGKGPQTTDVASKVVPPVLCVLLVIGVMVFLIKRNQHAYCPFPDVSHWRGSQTAHEAIAMDDQDNDSQPMAEGSLQTDVP